MKPRPVSRLISNDESVRNFTDQTDSGASERNVGQATQLTSSSQSLKEIINAVLYEGYILYPYRASSQKNQRERFTFGRVYPKVYSDKQNGVEPCFVQSECLVQTHGVTARLEITAGFLQPVLRQICRLASPAQGVSIERGEEFQPVAQLEVNDRIHQTWLEAMERNVTTTVGLADQEIQVPFNFGGSQQSDSLLDAGGRICGVIRRQQELIEGTIVIRVQSIADNVFKLMARIINSSRLGAEDLEFSESVLRRCFASTHFAFLVENGRFISMLDVPPEFKTFADNCENRGVWPVLVGDEHHDERDIMLASPIILYDYPTISHESPGSFFDGTEIDEMLTLRVLTMTDEEKREMHADEFSRGILERTHALDAEGILKLHGSMQPLKASRTHDESGFQAEFFNPAAPVKTVLVEGVELKAGDRVSIHPKRRADAMDLMLAGKVALIESVEQDAEDKIHLALVLEEDPGKDLGLARQSGHRFFYEADEVKPLRTESVS